MYFKIPGEWLEAQKQAFIVAQNDVQFKTAAWELEQVSGPDRLDIQNDMEGYEERSQSGKAAMAGLLFNISRNMAGFIEQQIIYKAELFREKYEAEYAEKIRKRYRR